MFLFSFKANQWISVLYDLRGCLPAIFKQVLKDKIVQKAKVIS
jgi:hypothetical protein